MGVTLAPGKVNEGTLARGGETVVGFDTVGAVRVVELRGGDNSIGDCAEARFPHHAIANTTLADRPKAVPVVRS